MSVCCIWCRDNSKFKLRMYHAFSNKLRKKGLKATLMWSQLLHTCTETVDITGFWGFFANFLQLCQTGLWSSPLVINWVHFAFHFTTKRHTHTVSLEADLIFCPDCMMPFWVVNWIFRATAINARQVSHLWPMPFMCSQWMWPHIKHRGVCFHICHSLNFSLILLQTTQHKVTLCCVIEDIRSPGIFCFNVQCELSYPKNFLP